MPKKKKENPELSEDILSKADMIKDLFINLDYLNRLIHKADLKLKKKFTALDLIAILEVYPQESNAAFDTIYTRIVTAIESVETTKALEYKKREVIPDVEYGGLFSKRFIQ